MEIQTASRRVKWIWVALSTFAVLCGGLVLFLLPRVEAAREAARHTQCRGMLGKLELALQNYHEVHGSFPPAFVADAEGKPMHSWRVLILPYLDGMETYRSYRFEEPWNSPHNLKLATLQASERFRCPSRTKKHLAPTTNYVLVVGNGTAFPGAGTTTLADFKDGAENTILVAEIDNSDIHWMEPRDLDASTMSFLVNDRARPSISSPHPAGPAVVFADRIQSFRLPDSLDPAILRAMTTIAGGETVDKEAAIDPPVRNR